MDVAGPEAAPPGVVEAHLLLPERLHGGPLPLPRPPHAQPRPLRGGGTYVIDTL